MAGITTGQRELVRSDKLLSVFWLRRTSRDESTNIVIEQMRMTETVPSPRKVPIGDAFWTWCRVAALSVGGPAGQIAVMHRIIVKEKKWISEERFLHALNFCMLIPGPEAQQLATYLCFYRNSFVFCEKLSVPLRVKVAE